MKLNRDELFELTTPDGGRFRVSTESEAFQFCKNITLGHYENFPVASLLIEKQYRQYIFAIYTFARIADDIADELIHESADSRIEALNNYQKLINFRNPGIITNPVFIALKKTIDYCTINPDSLKRLLTAFKIDINFIQPYDFDDLLFYCSYSANPVGELILKIFNEDNDFNIELSNYICTGLQLINFWQDISLDLLKNRIFIPQEMLDKYEISHDNLYKKEKSVKLSVCLEEIYNYTYDYINKGYGLIKNIKNKSLQREIKATYLGGMSILQKVITLKTDILDIRPKLNYIDYTVIILKTLFN